MFSKKIKARFSRFFVGQYLKLLPGIYCLISLTALLGMSLFAYHGLNNMEATCGTNMNHIRSTAALDSELALNQLGEKLIACESEHIAKQIDLYLDMHPRMTVQELRNTPEFRKIALQVIGRAGYSAVLNDEDGMLYFHERREFENQAFSIFEKDFPALWKINAGRKPGQTAKGYYQWIEQNGKLRQKFLWITPCKQRTADGVRFAVMATTYMDEFSAPAQLLNSRLQSELGLQLTELQESSTRIYLILLAMIISIQLITGGLVGFMLFQMLHSRNQLTAKNAELGEREVQLMILVQELDMVREQIEQERGEMKQLVESIDSIMIGLDDQMRITQWNHRASLVFGLLPTQMLGQVFWGCGIHWNWPTVLDQIEICFNNDHPAHIDQLAYRRSDGESGFMSLALTPVKNGSGKSVGVVILATEITERLLMESQMSQSQKLESIGQLAAGIAHEINTPIQYVGDNTNFLRDSIIGIFDLIGQYRDLVDQDPLAVDRAAALEKINETIDRIDLDYLKTEIPAAIDQSLEGVGRVAGIVLAMKEFSHPDDGRKTTIDLNRAIESTITVSRNEWKYIADLKTHFDPDLPSVACLPGEFNQVILNMLINASHAVLDKVGPGGINGKGTIEVGTRRSGEQVEIYVSDTGTGIPLPVRSRIFDPFFTTKEVGRGTGQGLAMAHNVIVKKHNGTISFDTEEGKGTTFTIRIPIGV